MSRIEIIDENISSHDGVFFTTRAFTYMDIYIPKGFTWNGVSYFFTSEKMVYPSMIHDFLLRNNYIRSYCDKMFMTSMIEQNVCWIGRTIAITLVRLWSKTKGE